LRAFRDEGVRYLKLNKCLAGDAVEFAPVSARIPCKQGILQGIMRFRGHENELPCKKPLRRSDILSSPLRKLTGKIFRRTGILQTETGKTARGNYHLKGHLQTFGEREPMSALSPKADIRVTHRHVGFGPASDIGTAAI
jgi:hypothetical protein